MIAFGAQFDVDYTEFSYHTKKGSYITMIGFRKRIRFEFTEQYTQKCVLIQARLNLFRRNVCCIDFDTMDGIGTPLFFLQTKVVVCYLF